MSAEPHDIQTTVVDDDGRSGIRLCLHEGQQKAWDSTRRFVFIIAGTQSGKTSFGPWWLAREIHTCGPGDYLAVTATYDLFKLKMLPEMKHVFCDLLGGEGWKWEASDKLITNEDTRIILRSADAEGGLESATAKAAWLDECGQDRFGVGAWEAAQRRLALAEGRALGTTTPYNLGWLKQQVFDRWRAGDLDYQVIQFKSTMNPRFPVAEYERAKRTLPAWKHAMFYDGEFSRPAGQIYSDFSTEENVVQPFSIPRDWVRRVGIDFGGANNALIWLAEDPKTGVHFAYREVLEGGKSTREHVQANLTRSLGENVVRWLGGAPSESQQRRDWKTEGIQVDEPRIPDLEAGIDRVIEMVKTRKLKVFSTCTGLLDEFGRYSRKLSETGEVMDEIVDKRTFHRLDALRYVASGIVSAPAQRVIRSFSTR